MSDDQDRDTKRMLDVRTHDDDGRHLRSGDVETWGIARQEIDGHKVVSRLDSGAGHGHARLSLLVELDGERVAHEYIDVSTLIELWANAVVDAEMEKRKDSPS